MPRTSFRPGRGIAEVVARADGPHFRCVFAAC